MVPYSSQPKLTTKEQEESAKRARSRISSSPESKLQQEQQFNRYELLSADPDDDKGEELMEYQDELEDDFRDEIDQKITEALDTTIEVAQSRTNKLCVEHIRTNLGTNTPKLTPGSGSNGASKKNDELPVGTRTNCR